MECKFKEEEKLNICILETPDPHRTFEVPNYECEEEFWYAKYVVRPSQQPEDRWNLLWRRLKSFEN